MSDATAPDPPNGSRAGLSGRAWALLILIGVVFAAYNGLHLATFMLLGDTIFTDYVGLWSFGRFPLLQPAVEIYQAAALRPFQHAEVPGFDNFLPYPYPPFFLLVLAPFGALPIGVARLLWLSLSGAAMLAAAMAMQGGTRSGWRQWQMVLAILLGVVLTPLSLINILFGQTGFLTAALLCGGLVLLPKRPIWAGILFGLLACKPQLGLLVPVALLAARAWGAILAALLTVLALALASSLIFGWDLWAPWFGSLVGHVGLMETGVVLQKRLMPTVLITMQGWGMPRWLAWGAQGGIFLAMLVLVWRAYRRDPGVASAAVLIAGTYLSTPYGFVYDMPAVGVAMWALLARRLMAGGALPMAELALLLVGQMAAAATSWGPPGGAVMVEAVLCLLLVLAWDQIPRGVLSADTRFLGV